MSEVIPNSFQTPNIHADRVMEYLSGDEYKVLNFAVRHIYGWQANMVKRQGEISLSRFVDGYTTSEGKRFGGVGLGRPTIIKILKTLVKFGLLVKVGDATASGQTWSIGLDPNWQAMEQRHCQKKQTGRDKTAKATVASIVARTSGTSDDTGNVKRTGAGTSDDTHINPLLNPSSNPPLAADAAPDVSPVPKQQKRERKSTAPKPRSEYEQPDVMYETVERVVFVTEGTPDMPYDWKSHCGYITKWLKGEIAKWNKQEFGKISAPALPEHVERFIKWYRVTHPTWDLPTTPASFVKYWRQWATAMKGGVNGRVLSPPIAPLPQLNAEDRAALSEQIRAMKEGIAANG